MKGIFVLVAAAATLGAAAPQTSGRDLPSATDGNGAAAMPNVHAVRDFACRDRVTQARAERGLPLLERNTADPDEPLFFAAVDHRLDGCSVLVMRNNTSDIRPVPALPEGRPMLIPAR